MKTKLIIIALILSTAIGATIVVAQYSKNTAEEKAENLTHRMVEVYGLTVEQTEKISKLNLTFFQNSFDLDIKYKKSLGELKAKHNELQTKYDADVFAILDAEQKEIYMQEQIKIKEKPKTQQKEKPASN